jgi:hypothetical protein
MLSAAEQLEREVTKRVTASVTASVTARINAEFADFLKNNLIKALKSKIGTLDHSLERQIKSINDLKALVYFIEEIDNFDSIEEFSKKICFSVNSTQNIKF